MQQELHFNITLPIGIKLKYIKNKSHYNNNYYLLEEYGEWFNFGKNKILREHYDEAYETYEYSFGYFDDTGMYCSELSYISFEDILKDIPTEEIDY